MPILASGAVIFHILEIKEKRMPPHARSLSSFLCSIPARLPALLHSAQFRLLLALTCAAIFSSSHPSSSLPGERK